MPRRKAFDKKTAQTFTLVHRAQNDPLIHDQDAPSMVFTEKQAKQPRRPTEDDYAYSSAGSIFSGSNDDAGYRSKKVKQRGDLEEEFALAVRPNEGEAAEYGVYFDDTEYDYMQHMRDLGSGEGGVAWIDAKAPPQKQKKKEKLEDALRSMDLDRSSEGGSRFDDAAQSVGTSSSAARSFLPDELLPSEFVRKRTYQDQQDVPDEIAGFQPDMDPELREALMALEDEEFVDDADEEDLFGQLVVDGYEIEKNEFEWIGEQGMFEEGEDDGGWESDDTIKGRSSPPPLNTIHSAHTTQEVEPAKPPENTQAQPPADPTEGAWIDEFKKFKSASKTSAAPTGPQSSLASARQKLANRKTGGSISTTTSRAQTEAQALLDARFEKLMEREYSDFPDEDGQFDDALSTTSGLSKAPSAFSQASNASNYSRSSSAVGGPQSVRTDFDGIIDEFLGSTSRVGKRGKRVRQMGAQTGMEQLEEVRRGLGPARLKSAVK